MKRILTVIMLTGVALLLVVLFKGMGAFAQSKINQGPVSRRIVKYPTMLDMTFPEFETAAKRTNVVLLPIGAIEEHSSHLPLGTDAMNATAQLFYVQNYLRGAGFETIFGPQLSIGVEIVAVVCTEGVVTGQGDKITCGTDN